MQNAFYENFDSFYFIGIGGVSMSALARYLTYRGKKTAGSDICVNRYVEELRQEGIAVSTSPEKESLADFGVVVYTDAIPENDLRLAEAKRLGKYIISRGQLLYEISRNFSNVIAVSGCHGKTTCTAMLAHIFFAAGKNFCAHIGGRDKKFSNMFCGGYDYFITEACEYKKNFLLLKPDIAVILNSRPDHLECYGSEENLKQCYKQFASFAPMKIALYGDVIDECLTFGFDRNANYSAKNIVGNGGLYSFTAYEGDSELGRAELSIYGKHNVLNALAAIAVARSAQIPFCKIKEGLKNFTGVERRFESIGEINGAECIADYAHHPDEIRATLRAANKLTEGRLFVVFQPHTYSRTRALFKHFVRVLSPINNLLIYRTYAAREYFDDGGSALTLSQKIKKSRYGDSERDILDFLSKAEAGDKILFLGAGDIYEIALRLIKSLSPNPSVRVRPKNQ